MNALERALDGFRRRFGRDPEAAAAAPGRVNLIGEHTDYSGGFVLPIAIDRESVILAARADERSTLVALDLGREVVLDLSRPLAPIARGAPHFFANYVTGVVRQFQDMGAPAGNLDVTVASDVPVGAGLASSASVEVATATLLERITGIRLDAVDKAKLCQRAEHAFPGTPCGVMDMFISTCAVAGHALLIDCASNEARPIPLDFGEDMVILVVDTGVKHDLAAGEYADRRATCEAAAAKLGVPSLRDATLAMIGRRELTEIEQRRTAHVVQENARVVLAVAALLAGQADEFCARMYESHASLRDLYAVSCPELDVVVNACADLANVTGDRLLGARMTGGGFGGCAVVLCRAALAPHVEEFIRARFLGSFAREPSIFSTSAAGGARTIDL